MDKYVSEEELNQKAVAPRVTLEEIEANITGEFYFRASDGVTLEQARAFNFEEAEALREKMPMALTLITYCVLVLKNGYTVTGQSACASPENYDEEIGRRVARGDAIRQVWPLMGYELRSRLHRLDRLSSTDERLGEALTHLTAYGLGNKDALSMTHVDAILSHFLHDHQEEGGRTFASDAIKQAADLDREPVHFSGYVEVKPLIERNELGAQHPDEIAEPTIKEEGVA